MKIKIKGKDYTVNTVKIRERDKTKEVQAFLNEYAVYDNRSCNFHIFPNCVIKCGNLSEEFENLRSIIIDKLSKKGENNQHEWVNCETQEDFSSKIKNAKTNLNKYLIKGSGTGKTFTRLSESLKNCSCPEKEKRISNTKLYKYIDVYYKEYHYILNFMRYTCNENGVVGCTMRAIQFHKFYSNINKANGFNICYTINDEDNKYKKSIKYNIRKKENQYENVCYNPPVEYPFKDSGDKEGKITEIVNRFIFFIESEGEKEKLTEEKYKEWLNNQNKISISIL